jgi:hypothetical protein
MAPIVRSPTHLNAAMAQPQGQRATEWAAAAPAAPGSAAGAAARPPSASAPVRPVTSRTYGRLDAEAPQTVFDNAAFSEAASGSGAADVPGDADAAAAHPLYKPLSAAGRAPPAAAPPARPMSRLGVDRAMATPPAAPTPPPAATSVQVPPAARLAPGAGAPAARGAAIKLKRFDLSAPGEEQPASSAVAAAAAAAAMAAAVAAAAPVMAAPPAAPRPAASATSAADEFTIMAVGARPATADAAASAAAAIGGGAPGDPARPSPEAMAAFVTATREFVAAPPGGASARAGSFAALVAAQVAKEAAAPAALAAAALASAAGARRLLAAPGPISAPVRCRVARTRGGFLGTALSYALALDGGGPELLVAERRLRASAAARFDITMAAGGRRVCLATLTAGLLGTEFTLAGVAEAGGEGVAELAACLYTPRAPGARGPRKLTVVLPKLVPSAAAGGELRPAPSAAPLRERHRVGDAAGTVALRGRPPRWSPALGAYCLNFGGRVTRASVKNLQLVAPGDPERVVVQFGRVGDDAFTLDFAFPATPLQAFAVAVASLHPKLGVE